MILWFKIMTYFQWTLCNSSWIFSYRHFVLLLLFHHAKFQATWMCQPWKTLPNRLLRLHASYFNLVLVWTEVNSEWSWSPPDLVVRFSGRGASGRISTGHRGAGRPVAVLRTLQRVDENNGDPGQLCPCDGGGLHGKRKWVDSRFWPQTGVFANRDATQNHFCQRRNTQGACGVCSHSLTTSRKTHFQISTAGPQEYQVPTSVLENTLLFCPWGFTKMVWLVFWLFVVSCEAAIRRAQRRALRAQRWQSSQTTPSLK